MKPWYTVHFALQLAILFLAPTFSTPVIGEEMLEYKYKEGDKLQCTMQQQIKTTVDVGTQKIKNTVGQTMHMTWLIKTVDEEGTAIVEQTIDQLEFKLTTQNGDAKPEEIAYDSKSETRPQGTSASVLTSMFDAIAGQTFTVKMNKRGEILKVEVPEKVTQALESSPAGNALSEMFSEEGFTKTMQASALAFPEGGVTEGKTWSKSFKMNNANLPSGAVTTELQYKYVGKEEVDGKSLDKVLTEMKLDFGETEGTENINIKNQDSGGVIYFDAAAGRITTAKAKSKIDMVVPAAGQSLNMAMDQTMEMTFKPIQE